MWEDSKDDYDDECRREAMLDEWLEHIEKEEE